VLISFDIAVKSRAKTRKLHVATAGFGGDSEAIPRGTHCTLRASTAKGNDRQNIRTLLELKLHRRRIDGDKATPVAP
jgi:hypothetical protein